MNITLKSETCRALEVRLIHAGDKYGLNDCLTWEGETGIEFTDISTPFRQFTGGLYYLDTILKHKGGLMLNGDSPEWTISGQEMAKVMRAYFKS